MSRAGKVAKTITIIVLLIFSFAMVKTSSLMVLQIINIVICAIIFKSKNTLQNENVSYRPPIRNYRASIDCVGDANGNPRSQDELKRIQRQRYYRQLKNNFNVFIQSLGCLLLFLLIFYGLLHLVLS